MTELTNNPFANRSVLEFELPPFSQIREEHYLPAFYAGMERQLAEVQAILDSPGEATFENTIVALEKSGKILERVSMVFFNRTSSDTNDALEAMRAEIAPKLSAHHDAIMLNPKFFARIKSLFDNCESLNLNSEDSWLLERYYKDLIQAGAHLTDAQRTRLTELNGALSKLATTFSKNLLSDTNDLAVIVDSVEELDGLTANEITAAETAARDRGLEGKWLLSQVNFTGNPLLDSLTNRTLRQLSIATPADFSRSVASNLAFRSAAGVAIESWDWGFFTEKVRLEKYNIDTAKMQPYFELERVLHDGVFFAANKLFGITFKERPDLVTYHPEARAFEVSNEDGTPLALFIGDFFTRDSKRGGAWMNSLVKQNFLLNQLPVVVNNLNIPKPPAGQPALLTLDFTTTLFHEFGPAKYP